MYPAGHPRRTLLPDLVRSMSAKDAEAGIASQDELAQLDRQVRQRLADPSTLTWPACTSWPGGANWTPRGT